MMSESNPQPPKPASSSSNEGAEKLPWTDENSLNAWEATLERARTDEEFRKRCLGSSDSARAALSEAGNINVPPDLRILFLDCQPDLNCAVVLLPSFESRGPIDFAAQVMCCGYQPYVRILR